MAAYGNVPNFSYRSVRSIDTTHNASEFDETVPVAPSWRHRLSTFTKITLVFSCATVPAVIAMLCFLWSNPALDQFRPTWRDLVLGGWTVQTITMSTVLLRTAVAGSAA